MRTRHLDSLRALCAALLLGTAGLLAAGCSSAAGTTAPAADGKIDAVGAENEYADVLSQIGGTYVAVSAIMSNPNADPHTFDMRVLAIIRRFLRASKAPMRRTNVEAAAFVAFHSVRATMLANLLECPPSLGEAALVEELVDLVLRYLVRADPAG